MITNNRNYEKPKLEMITGENGVSIINDTKLHSIDASLIEFSSDAIVSILKYKGSNNNIVAEKISSPTSETGDNGITAVIGKKFSAIKLDAGTCTIVK